MSKQLHISPDLIFPLDAVTQKIAWLGRTGSGKTYGASKLAEEMLRAHAQVVTIDAVGVWYGIRIDADGKSPGIAIPVFGGLHGDLPLEPGAGAYVADLVVDHGLSLILDVSQFEHDSEKARFAGDFANRFFFRKKAAPSAVHLFLEECQEFVPQNPQKGEEKMLHAFQRIEKLGRNFGIGVSLISQRPQEVNKKALNQTEMLFAFQMTGPQERKAIEIWIAEKGLDTSITDLLPKLSVGEAYVWSPQWLKISKRVHIAKKQTFNASSTPEVGSAAVERHLAPINLESVRKEMASTIEKQKANDPALLKKRIAQLEKEVAAKPKAEADPAAVLRQIESAVAQAVKTTAGECQTAIRGLLGIAKKQQERLQYIADKALEIANAPLPEIVPPPKLAVSKEVLAIAKRPFPRTINAPVPLPRASEATQSELSRPQRDLLSALAESEAIGRDAISRSWLAFLAGVSPKSSGFEKNVSTLSSKGLVCYPQQGQVALTPEGRGIAGSVDAVLDTDAMFERVYKMLSSPQAQLLKILRHASPHSMSREELAERAGISALSSGYEKNVSTLSSRELVTYPGKGMVRCADWLFIE